MVIGFYIALHSDSSLSFFPENKISECTRKLPCEIVIEGERECGVSEVCYHKTFYNIENEEIAIINVKNTIKQDVIRVHEGFWKKEELIAELN